MCFLCFRSHLTLVEAEKMRNAKLYVTRITEALRMTEAFGLILPSFCGSSNLCQGFQQLHGSFV